MNRALVIVAFWLLLVAGLAAQEKVEGKAATRPAPKRVMVLVFDQMRAEYIERFQLKNFQRAQSLGVNFANAQVGHLESNTIISHPVISSGVLPRNLPWGIQVALDADGLLGSDPQFFMPANLSPQQWLALLEKKVGEASLPARIKSVHSGQVFAVAQKRYAAYTFGGPYADTIIGLGSVFKEGELAGHHRLAGKNIPGYIASPVGNRFYLEGVNRWGSDQEGYALKGSGYVTGEEPERPGGDVWVGDVVELIMQREPEWSGILASFGAIDKVSHVLAEHDGPSDRAWARQHGISLKDTLKKADRELGRILDRLETSELLAETVVVITADHGGQHSRFFHGRRIPGRHAHDSYYGRGSNFDYTDDPPPVLKPLVELGTLRAASLNTMVSCWTEQLSQQQHLEFVRRLSQVRGVCEVYRKGADGYERCFRSSKMSARAISWADTHHLRLLDSIRGPAGPDYVGLVFDNHGYAIIGGHGGAQELVQRIPFIVIAPSRLRTGAVSQAVARLVDVNALVGRLLELPDHPRLDGDSTLLEPFLLDRSR